jgi:hypothetical protein
MEVTVHIPDGDLSRRALEGLALEEYKSGRITEPELLLLLGFQTRYELDGFLKAHGVFEEFSVEEFERDLADLKSAGF